MTELAFQSATHLSASLRAGRISSAELTDYFIGRIERYDTEINAVVVRDFERARAAAKQADEARSAGHPLGPLHGLPMTIKESYDVEGLPTTWGFPDFKDNLAVRDSLVAERYKHAGAVLLGKTNVPVALADFQSYNPIYGTTGNPWDRERTPGGSSGGSAAALAAGLTGLETGSDIGGSIRNPAHFCGLYGHKPSYEVVPQEGHALPGALAPVDLAVCGPLARSAEDLALALDVIAGPDQRRAAGVEFHLPRPAPKPWNALRIALWPTDEIAPVSHEVAERARQVGETLRSLGATVSETARPDFDVRLAHVTYLSLLHSVMGETLPEAQEREIRARADALDPRDLSNRAVTERGMVLSHRQWLAHHNERTRLRDCWRAFFDDWDILICPQMATPAFPHDQSPPGPRTLEVDGASQPYFDQVFWAGLAVAAYLPSTVFPTGPAQSGLPIGLQAIGAEWDDYKTIEFAGRLGEHLGGFRAPPGFAD